MFWRGRAKEEGRKEPQHWSHPRQLRQKPRFGRRPPPHDAPWLVAKAFGLLKAEAADAGALRVHTEGRIRREW